MNINQRIRVLRKSLKMNQRDFGQQIGGMGQAGVSWLEQDGHTITDANIKLICNTFGVSERWLRDGSGDMHAQTRDDYVREFAERCGLGDTFVRIMNSFLSIDEADRAAAYRVITKVAADLMDGTADAEAARTASIDAKVAAYRAELIAEQEKSSSSSTPADAPADESEKRA